MRDVEPLLRTGSGVNMGFNITTAEDGGYTHVPQLGDAIIDAVAEINPLLADVRRISTSANEYHQLFTVSRRWFWPRC